MFEFIIFIGFVVVVICATVFVVMHNNKKELRAHINSNPEFAGEEVLASARVALACSVSSSQFAVAWRTNNVLNFKILPADALISVDVERVGEASESKKTGFGKFSTDSGAKEINLCLHFRDSEVPIVRIALYVRAGDNDFGEQHAMSVGRTWESKVLAVAHAAPAPRTEVLVSPVPAPASSVAAEISSLHRLLVDGVLSEEEFQAAKLAVISR